MLQDNHGAEAAAPSRLLGHHVYLSTSAADWLFHAGGEAPPEAEVAAAHSGAEVARWERFGGNGVGGGSSAGYSRPSVLTPLPCCRSVPLSRPRRCPPSLCGPRTLPPAAPWGPSREGQWAAEDSSSRSGLCGPAQSPRAGGTLPAVAPGTGSAARPGEVRTPRGPPEGCGKSVGLHSAPVLPVPPGFSWNPSAQRDKFGPGLVYSSRAFNACLILN